MKIPKIIKSFSSNEYAKYLNDKYEGKLMYNPRLEIIKDNIKPFLEWGLSDDGTLCCCGCFSYCNYPNWVKYEHCAFSISLAEMKKIVKEFANLVIFT